MIRSQLTLAGTLLVAMAVAQPDGGWTTTFVADMSDLSSTGQIGFIAMDRARVVSLTDTLSTPAGKLTNVLVTEETTQLEPGREYKRYARGVGLIQDGDLKLVSHR